MGSLGNEISKKGSSELGEKIWQTHLNTVNGFWEAIQHYFETTKLYIKGIKLYQDGMFAEGEMSMKIIEESTKAGSINFEIVAKLINLGAILIRTEDFKMVKDEYDFLQSIIQAKSAFKKLIHALKYKIYKPQFLIRRDKFIAGRIDETLLANETGILFIGAYHNIIKRLPKDITVIELKEVAKIREYQKAIQSYPKINTQKFELLTQYMIKS